MCVFSVGIITFHVSHDGANWCSRFLIKSLISCTSVIAASSGLRRCLPPGSISNPSSRSMWCGMGEDLWTELLMIHSTSDCVGLCVERGCPQAKSNNARTITEQESTSLFSICACTMKIQSRKTTQWHSVDGIAIINNVIFMAYTCYHMSYWPALVHGA